MLPHTLLCLCPCPFLSPFHSPQGELADYDGSEGHPGHRRLADPSTYAALESDMVFLGLAGLQDPPRPEVGGRRLLRCCFCVVPSCGCEAWELQPSRATPALPTL